MPSNDVVKHEEAPVAIYERNATRILTTEDLSAITSKDDVLRLIADLGFVAETAEQYGTGFDILPDKKILVGVPFIIVEWRFNASALSEGGFVSASLVTEDGRKFILNDGGQGIFKQLTSVTESRNKRNHPHPQNILIVDKGLVESNYDTTVNINGKDTVINGTTYYLAGM